MAVWQFIRDTIAGEIEQGIIAAGGRLPGDHDLALRFGVNRHTVRRALSHLQSEGFVRSERGRGTFVVEDAIAFSLGVRTRFEENLLDNQRLPSRRMLSAIEFAAPETVARQLAIEAGAPILVATMLGEADGVPVHFQKMHFPLERLPGLVDAVKALPIDHPVNVSLEQLLGRAGVRDFQRKTIRLRSRMPEPEEARHLKMSMHEPIMETEIVNVESNAVPLFLGVAIYCSSRIEFIVNY